MAAKLLMYHTDDGTRPILEGLCRPMGITPAAVGDDEWNVPIGILSGSLSASAGLAPAREACPDSGARSREMMIVMCGFTKTQFDSLLDMLRMAQIRISLKAVETPSNRNWSGEMLQAELRRERAAFEKGNRSVSREKADRAGRAADKPPRLSGPSGETHPAIHSIHHSRLTRQDIEELAREAVRVIPERVAYYAPKVGVTYGRITIRNQRSRWGSCSSKGNLNFNCLLMLAPREVLDSVIVHELCHRLEMNHSKRFYEHVLRVYPEYYRYHAWLKENGQALMRRMTG